MDCSRSITCAEPRSVQTVVIPGQAQAHGPATVHPRQHRAARRAAGAGDPPASGRRVAADLAQDRGGAGRDERAAALLGVRLGGRAGAGALHPRQPRTWSPAAACSTSARAAGSRRSRRCGPAPRACSPPTSMLSRWRPSASTLPPTPWLSRRHGADLLARQQPDRFDVVLVGDLFYERHAGRARAGLHRGGQRQAARRSWSAIPRRSYFPKDRFRQVAEYSVPVTRELEDAEIKRTAVWRLATSPIRRMGRGTPTSRPIDAALVAIVAGRAHVDVGDARVAEHLLRRLAPWPREPRSCRCRRRCDRRRRSRGSDSPCARGTWPARPRCRDGAGSSRRAGRSAPARRRAAAAGNGRCARMR